MCGIAGFYQSHFDYLTEEDHYRQILEDMEKVQKHRGPNLVYCHLFIPALIGAHVPLPSFF